ncbi:4-amino-4-deoxy-L-arabinose-phospho-UDP flippase, partial [Serratia marcescens]|nr:4-amino-4-deoxy-L-arabinose-phospho-UDP flippase [Serratia marcescens]
IFGYALSMLCWFFALRHLPLNRAYLLSVSHALVYLAAVILPWFNESATLLKTLGTLFILFGVGLINSKPTTKSPE